MKKQRDLSGQQFGRWKVQPQYRLKNGIRQWLCVCSCEEKTARYVYESNLLQGYSQSCGCLSREKAKERYIDLTGRWFGELEVISKAENKNDRIAWHCKCRCGKEKILTSHDLICDGRQNCGGRVHRIGKNIRDLTCIDLNGMEALYPTKERDYKGSVMWQCRCKKCGAQKLLSEDALVHGNYKSCGCTRYENSTQLLEYRHFYQGTCLEALQRKIRSDNSTGVIGVTQTETGRYKADITFQGKSYSLGSYGTLEEAAGVRRSAEEQLHLPFIRAYTAWMESTEESKEELVFEVNYINGEFLIYSNYLVGMEAD